MARPRIMVLTLLAAATLSACVVAPYYPQRGGYDSQRGGYAEPAYNSGPPLAVVDAPPPTPYAEVIPVIPFVGALWIGGYWGWGGGRHNWVPGYWERPRPGYVWRPHRWEPISGRWQLHGGAWARSR